MLNPENTTKKLLEKDAWLHEAIMQARDFAAQQTEAQ